MVFEGSEKKFELVINQKGGNLLELSDDFWSQVVNSSGAQILTSVTNSKLKAFLLSESSLFVWHDRVLMITCGQTTLVSGALFLIDELNSQSLESFIYQRKNEYFPGKQHSHFVDDVGFLSEKIEGSCLLLGNPKQRHLNIFSTNKKYQPAKDDSTLEVLMYGFGDKIKPILTSNKLSAETIRKKCGIDQILPGFEINDWAFEPIGYSLNAIKDELYYTIHVTPEDKAPYISFETNVDFDPNASDLVAKIINVFQPDHFDLVAFRSHGPCQVSLPGIKTIHTESSKIESGYEVTYGSYDSSTLRG